MEFVTIAAGDLTEARHGTEVNCSVQGPHDLTPHLRAFANEYRRRYLTVIDLDSLPFIYVTARGRATVLPTKTILRNPRGSAIQIWSFLKADL